MKTLAYGAFLALLAAAPAAAQSLDANVPTPPASLQALSPSPAAAHKTAPKARAAAPGTAGTVQPDEFVDPDPVIRFHLLREAGCGMS
jgi:hypothetical protein